MLCTPKYISFMKSFFILSLLAVSSAFAPQSIKQQWSVILSGGNHRRTSELHSSVTSNESVSTTAASKKSGISISTDDEYPQNFSGRLWFNPALVKVQKLVQAQTVMFCLFLDIRWEELSHWIMTLHLLDPTVNT